jgi:hypothetical protein
MRSITSGQYTVRASGPLSRWFVLIALSILLHAIALDWAVRGIDPASHKADSNQVIAANIVQLPSENVPHAAVHVRHAPPKKKRLRRPLPPAPHIPARAPEAPVSTEAISVPTDSPPTAEATAQADMPAQQPSTQDDTLTSPVEDKQASAPQPTYKIAPPPSVDLYYDVTKTPVDGTTIRGRGKIAWRLENGAYKIDGEVSWLFITALRFSSEGMIDEYGVSPVLYNQKSFRRSATNTHFQHERNVISFSASENSYPRQGGEQDRASIIWQLAGIGRADDTRFTPGAEFEIVVAGVRDEEPWLFHVIGKEDISAGIGNVEAWHLVRAPKPGSYDQTLDIWLAPMHEWYPVKLRYTEANGDRLDLDLSKTSIAATE